MAETTATAVDQGRHPGLLKPNRDLRGEVLASLEHLPGGDRVNRCIQCGTCSGSCPVSWAMDWSPRQVLAFLRAGDIETVLESNTIWICASCYQCAARCPADIKLTDLMYALKRLAIDRRIFPRGFSAYVFSEIFVSQVRKYGRNYEAGLIGKYFMRLGLRETIKRAGAGWRLWRKGRIGMVPEKIKGLKDLRKIIDKAEQIEAAFERDQYKAPVDKVGYEAI